MTPATKTKNRITETNGIAVPQSFFDLDRLQIRCVGITPLLCNSPADMQPQSSDTTRKREKEKTVEEKARAAAYIDDDGDCAFPNSALAGCILSAAEMLKLKLGSGRMAPNVAGIIANGMTFDYDCVLTKIVHPKTGKPLRDYAIDMRRAVNQNTGGAIVAVRPRFDEWAMTFHLLIDSKNGDLMAVIANHFDNVLRCAGLSVGLGAFRAFVKPKKMAKRCAGGPFGKFVANIVD